MHSIVLHFIVLRRSQLCCIFNLLLCGYNAIQCYKFFRVLHSPQIKRILQTFFVHPRGWCSIYLHTITSIIRIFKLSNLNSLCDLLP